MEVKHKNKIAANLINNYGIIVNGNYSGKEFHYLKIKRVNHGN